MAKFSKMVAKQGNKAKGVPIPRTAKKLRAPKVLKVATEFSGMEAPIMAIRKFDPPLKFMHVSSSEVNPHCRKLINHMFQPGVLCEDAAARTDEESVESDVYVWGAPCKSWSSGGKQEGLACSNGQLVTVSLKYIKHRRPRLSLMENVANMAIQKKFKPVWKGILRAFSDLGYVNAWRIVDSVDHSVAQTRRRVYLVSIRKDSVHREMTWPLPSQPVTLTEVLVQKASDLPGRLPRKTSQKKLAKLAYGDALSKDINAVVTTLAVDIDCTQKYATYGVDVARTLTMARGGSGGPWLSTKGRRTDIEELFSIQGFKASDYDWQAAGVTKAQMGMMLGNTMSLPVVGQVLAEALWAAGLVASKPTFRV